MSSRGRTGGVRQNERPSPNVDQVLEDSFPASDPPSWTGAISRLRDAERDRSSDGIARRIALSFSRAHKEVLECASERS